MTTLTIIARPRPGSAGDLLARARRGDESARDQLWSLYAADATKAAVLAGGGEESASIAWLAFAAAIRTFDPSRGAGFGTHVTRAAFFQARQAVESDRLVAVPRYARSIFRAERPMAREYQVAMQRAMTPTQSLAVDPQDRRCDPCREVDARDFREWLISASGLTPIQEATWRAAFGGDEEPCPEIDLCTVFHISRAMVRHRLNICRIKFRLCLEANGYLQGGAL